MHLALFTIPFKSHKVTTTLRNRHSIDGNSRESPDELESHSGSGPPWRQQHRQRHEGGMCRKEPQVLGALKCRLSLSGRGGEAIAGEAGKESGVR